MDGSELRIIDTPGLADIGGIAMDQQHRKAMNDMLEAHVTNIDAVLILSNGTLQRQEVPIRYTLQTIMAMFPASIAENICFIFTHSTLTGSNATTSTFPPELRNPKHWRIENPLALYKNCQKLVNEGKTPERKLRRELQAVSDQYEDVVDTLNEWLSWLDTRKGHGTTAIIQLYETSIRIESKIQMMLRERQELTNKREELQRHNAELRTAVDVSS
ncbi:AIG1 domain-containing protein [Ceratobasidium sp. AG-Ba]|nr:AIG1 domain-containing protein [Ceratobasidium sp. AG-Ba]